MRPLQQAPQRQLLRLGQLEWLALPAAGGQQSPDMAGVIPNPELPLDHLAHPREGPETCGVSRLGAAPVPGSSPACAAGPRPTAAVALGSGVGRRPRGPAR